VTVYLSTQCNLTAQIEAEQDKLNYSYNYVFYLWIHCRLMSDDHNFSCLHVLLTNHVGKIVPLGWAYGVRKRGGQGSNERYKRWGSENLTCNGKHHPMLKITVVHCNLLLILFYIMHTQGTHSLVFRFILTKAGCYFQDYVKTNARSSIEMYLSND